MQSTPTYSNCYFKWKLTAANKMLKSIRERELSLSGPVKSFLLLIRRLCI